ncbi:MAG: thioredoxin family protein [Flavobacteriales bacterium]|nr:thioredoxin family protein [Flavobacteriales bacterium]
MKKIMILLLSSLAALGLNAQNRSIDFEKDYKKALKKAKAENKLIFLDAYATWCGPCKWMAANVFTNDEVADFYNSNFINLKMDMEKGEGKDIAEKFKIRSYPTLFFLDHEGNMIHKKVGASQELKSYIKLGEDAKNPERQYNTLKAKFEAGQTDKEFLENYMEVAGGAGDNITPILSKYYEPLSEKDMLEESTWHVIRKYDKSVDSKGIMFVMSHIDHFSAVYDHTEVDQLLYQNNYAKIMGILYSKDFSKKDFDIALIDLKKHKIPGWEKIVLAADIEHLNKQKKTREMCELAVLEVMEVFEHDPVALNNYAWMIFEKSDDPAELTEALKWADRSLLMSERSFVQDTHANLLNKLGRKSEAMASGKKAIELAKAEGEDVEDYEKALENYK